MRKIFMLILITVFCLSLLPSALMRAEEIETKETDDSFAEEGGNAYDSIKDKIWNSDDGALNELFESVKDTGESIAESDPIRAGWVFVFHIYDVVNAIYPAALIISMLTGFLTAMLSSKNKKRRKRAIVIGLITVPVLLTLFVYVMPYLYLKFA
ncbi:MAG: hypothetical protein IKS98_08135 [Lachnospiraceae bacterium]|nr:hypothetical protein [Lachnospiraceae bacterium]